MRITNNIIALQSNHRLFQTEKSLIGSSGRLNTGTRINSSKDDSAGMAIGNKMKSDILRLEMANRNALDAVSLTQTAEGALGEMHNIVQKMRELAVQSANDTLTTEDREKIQIEIDELTAEIDSMAGKTKFNGISLLSCERLDPNDPTSDYPTLTIQIGSKTGVDMDIKLNKVSAETLGIDALNYKTNAGSGDAITKCDAALEKISEIRTYFGAYQNRLEYTAVSLDNSIENASISLSRIMDTNMATEMTLYTQQNVISQAATSILAQANQRPQQILQLLG